MALFAGAQDFYVDSSAVANSSTVDISAIGLFFMYRPSATNNRSGVDYPGVSLFLVEMSGDVPNIANNSVFTNPARCEWNSIQTSSDASAETIFSFQNPITVATGKSYAFVYAYDGSEDFLPWSNIKGNDLVDTTTPSAGPSSPYGGHSFLFSSIADANTGALPTSTNNYSTAWTPLADTHLKFKVYCARYAINSVPIMANTSLPLDQQVYVSKLLYSYDANSGLVTIAKPSPRVENVTFDASTSLKQAFVGPQRVHQETVSWPGGGVYATVSSAQSNTLTANVSLSNGAPFSWYDVYGQYAGERWVVVRGADHSDVRRVTAIVSNTVVSLDEATTFSNSASKIHVSPVAVVDSFNVSILDGKKRSMLFLRDSSANATVRFTGDSLDFRNVTVANGGSGYSNSEFVYVSGYQHVTNVVTQNYSAKGTPTTNSTGGIVSIAWSNTGSGFVNAAAAKVVVSNTTGIVNNSVANTTSGSGLVLNLSFGTTLLTEQTNNIFRKVKIIDVDVHQCTPMMDLSHTANTTMIPTLSTQYYLGSANTPSGRSAFLGDPQVFPITLSTPTQLNALDRIPVVVSRSNEFGIHYANGVINDRVNPLTPYSNCYVLEIDTKTKNDYVALGPFNSPLIDFSRYVMNADYSNEHTDQGNALARHITTVVNFGGPESTSSMAEDLRVYLSAWRPPGTDVQAYARIKNSSDSSQAFSDGDWTRLTLVGANNHSTTGYTDLVFGFQGQPNTTITLPGTLSIGNNTANAVGSGTNWNTSLANNTLVKVYDPLFANDNFAVVLVTNVVNSSAIVMDQVFSTNTAAGIGGPELSGRGGLQMDVLGYGHQAFNNNQYDNVVRYYNLSEHVVDGYDTMQIKFLLLSNDARYVPRLHTLRGIGTSA